MQKKLLFLFLHLGCWMLTYGNLLAQTNHGCDGNRYRQSVFQNFSKKTVKYTTTKNYFGNNTDLVVDVYQPEGDDPNVVRPLIIFAHGGSFVTGSRDQMDAWCQEAVKRGYVAATMQYRLFPFLILGFPDSTKIMDAAFKATSDMKACIRYFRQDAAASNQFKIDPNFIFIGGYSAGAVTANLAAYLRLDDDMPSFVKSIINDNGGIEGNSGDASNLSFSSDAKLVMNISGGVYRTHWIDATEAPLYSIHGTADDVVPFVSGLAAGIAHLDGSGKIHPYANTIGLTNYLEKVDGGDHVNMYGATSTYRPKVLNYLDQTTAAMQTMICNTISADEEWAAAAKWSIFPNPASSHFSIKLPENKHTADVQVFDLAGKLVQQHFQIASEMPLPIAKLPNGVFFVKIVGLEGAQKLVIQKL